MFFFESIERITQFDFKQEAEQRRLEEEMQKRKNRIEQWRAERRTKLGIDKAMQQQIAQTAQVR